MIGIGPNIQCQPNISVHKYGASLAYDFTLGTLTPTEGNEAITFARSTTGTRYNISGQIETCAINQPRFDYDPITHACKGLLIEEQRTNLITYSEQFDNAAWTKVASTISANAATAPDGAVTMDKLVEDTSNAEHYTQQASAAHTAGATVTSSIFVQSAGRTKCRLRVQNGGNGCYVDADLTAGTIGTATAFGTGSATTASITNCGGGIYRVTVSGVPGGTTTSLLVQPLNASGLTSYTGDGSSGIYIWGAQVEVGAFATSYVPTTSATVTRTADVPTVINVTPWLSQTEATVYCEFDCANAPSGQFPRVWNLSDGTANNVIQLVMNGGTDTIFSEITSGGSQTFSGSFSSYIGAASKMALAYKGNNSNLAKDGVAGTTDTTVTIPSGLTQLKLGCDQVNNGGTFLNGHIKTWRYVPVRRPDADIASITT